MAKNDSYAGQLIDEIKALKEENEKMKENYEIVIRNLAKSREDYAERTTEVLKDVDLEKGKLVLKDGGKIIAEMY